MSYADRLQKLVEYQTNIRSALEAKGATISSDATLKDFPSAVDTITGDYTGPTPLDIMENGWGPYLSMVASVSYVKPYFFFQDSKITELKFLNCFSVGRNSFEGCSNLLQVSLPVCKKIEMCAFSSCGNLEGIELPLCESIAGFAFYSCCKMSYAILPNVSYLGDYTYSGCSSLKSIYAPNVNLLKDWTFANCTNLESISFPGCSILSGAVFYNCYRLEKTYFKSLNCISAQAWGVTFNNCYNIRSVYLLSSSICSLTHSAAFDKTPIAGSWNAVYCTKPNVYGSIFVPYSLMESYKGATNWTYYSSRIAGLVSFSATNLSEADSITTVLDGKIFSTEMEVPDTSFTYFVYSKYPKYTGNQDDIGENSSINITIPMDGIKLTVNTTPEDAIVTITEDGIIETNTKEKFFNSGETILLKATKKGYKSYKSTLTPTEDAVLDIELEQALIPEDITPENALKYTTFIDGINFEVNNGVIRSCSKSYNVDNGFSIGYIKLEIKDDCQLSINYSISSEPNFDFGVVMLTETPRDFTRDTLLNIPSDCTRLVCLTGSVNNASTEPITLLSGKTYYLYFAYTKDGGGNKNDDRFYIHSVKFEAIE